MVLGLLALGNVEIGVKVAIAAGAFSTRRRRRVQDSSLLFGVMKIKFIYYGLWRDHNYNKTCNETYNKT